jgi:Tfp pilus assembly PilM family ATPase
MNSVVGLDIRRDWIKVVELTRDLEIKRYGKIKIDEEDRIDNDDLYIQKIKELFHKSRISSNNVIINFRGSYVLARTYQPPSSNKEAFEMWFVENIQALIPGTPVEDVVYSYEILPSGRVLIAFARLGELEKLIGMLRKCGITPIFIDASCLPLRTAFANHPWIKERFDFAILDIDDTQADLLIVKEGEPFSANLISYGNQNDNDVLTAHLLRIFNFYERKDGIKINNIIIVGDYPKSSIKEHLEKSLGFKVDTGNPVRIQKLKSRLKNGGSYAQAIGLALKGFSQIGIDLTPHKIRIENEVLTFRKNAERYARTSLFFTIPALIFSLWLLISICKKDDTLKQDIDALKKEIVEMSLADNEVIEFHTRIQQLKKLLHNRLNWSEVLFEIAWAVPDGIYLKELSTETRLRADNPEPVNQTQIIIEGSAQSEEFVITFVKNLEKKFKNITLENMKSEAGCAFKISLEP